MVTEVVVKESLSSEMISAGAELTRLLDEAGFPVSASLWLYVSETNAWQFVIATPGVRDNGPRKAYEGIHAVHAKMPDIESKIPYRYITVVDAASDPLISLLRPLSHPGATHIRFTHMVIDGVLIEDAYIYRIT